MNALRMNMPEDVTVKVCKNSLVKIATLGEGFERFAAIAGEEKEITRMSNIWFYVPEDKMKVTVEGWAKHCKDFSGNEDRCSDIIGGAFDGTVLDAKGVDAISKLPTKQELMQSTAVAIKQTSATTRATVPTLLIAATEACAGAPRGVALRAECITVYRSW